MNLRERWSQGLMHAGYAAMLLGAFDPLEGALLVLPGSALVLAGTCLEPRQRPFAAYRLGVFALLALGIGALFGLSAAGGFGGKSGLSPGWAILLLPYLAGWPLGILGPGNPRWVHLGGVLVGLWLLTIPVILVRQTLLHPNPARPFLPEVLITVALLGAVTVGGCLWRLRHRPAPPTTAPRPAPPR
jgi:hypothetical protein